jgi:hypothetical protein
LASPEIGIDDPDQRHQRKIVPLGDQLRADDDIGLALGDRVELQPQPLHPAHDVGGQHDRPSLREMAFHLLGDPLHPRPAGDEMVEGAAFRAGLGRALVIAALMALQLFLEPVLDQPAGALRALEAMAADPAERQRRIAAPVEEQQRLLLLLHRLADRPHQHRRQEAAALRRMPAHVDQMQIGQRRVAESGRQMDGRVAPALAVDLAFDRRRRRHQHEGKSPIRARTTAMSRAL